MQYTQITVITTTQGSDLVSYLLSEAGSEGVNITDINDVKAVLLNKDCWDYVDESILSYKDERVFVRGYFEENADLSDVINEISNLKSDEFSYGSLEISVDKINSCDWENEWRKYYVPIELGNVVIVPAWIKYQGSIQNQVLIEPGMAFGTGNHETTSMCVELLQDFDLKGKKVADVGCGSGILGIAALKLGANECLFNDIDPQAIEATEQNIKLNNIENGYKLVLGNLDLSSSLADVVIANITADILIQLCSILKGYLKTGGVVIISGIINARANDVLSVFTEHFEVKTIRKKGEWQAMSLIKK